MPTQNTTQRKPEGGKKYLAFFSLALALLVTRIRRANHPFHTIPINNPTVLTNFFYRCPNFHNNLVSIKLQKKPVMIGLGKSLIYPTHTTWPR